MKCPVSDIEIIECPVTTCMWYSDKCKHNCALTGRETHEIDIAENKGLGIVEGYRETAKAKKAIQNVMILDRYYEWNKSRKGKKIRDKNLRKMAKEIRKDSLLKKENSNLFDITLSKFIEMCSQINYEEFSKSINVNIPELHIIIGVRKNKIDDLNNYLSQVNQKENKRKLNPKRK